MRVIVGEDEALLREGLVLILKRAGVEVVAAEGDAQQLLHAVFQHRPDVVVTDIRMPPTGADDGLRAALAIRAKLADTGVILLSQHLSRQYAIDLLSTGTAGVGYLLKQRISNAKQFVHDLRAVAAGETVVDPQLAADAVSSAARRHDAVAQLTPRQREVLELMARGLSNSAIGRELFITEKSVVEHVSRIYDALELPHTGDEHRRVLAVLRHVAH